MMELLIGVRMDLLAIAEQNRHVMLFIARERHHESARRLKKHLLLVYAIQTGIVLFVIFSTHNREILG